MRRAVILLAVACGGKPAPKPPQVSPAETLAKQLDDDLAKLAELASRYAVDCAALAAALRPHVDQMKAHAGEVATMTSDPVRKAELEAALAGYANRSPGRTDQTAKDLGTAYLRCPDADTKYRLEKAIADMPTFD
jgi:hypothetical protein